MGFDKSKAGWKEAPECVVGQAFLRESELWEVYVETSLYLPPTPLIVLGPKPKVVGKH